MTAALHQDNDLTDSKLASGFFAAASATRARPAAAQLTSTHLESAVFIYELAPECVVAPKKTEDPKCPELIAQAGRITGRMNETLSDQNVVESNIRFGEAVSVAHMVTSEGVELGTVVAKGFSVIKNVFTLGGYVARGAGTLGVGGTVIRGVPGTAAGDLINASIGNQQLLTVGGAVFEETGSTVAGAVTLGFAGKAFDRFRDAAGSGRGAVNAAYSASAALQRSYYQDAQRLKDVRAEIKERGCGGN